MTAGDIAFWFSLPVKAQLCQNCVSYSESICLSSFLSQNIDRDAVFYAATVSGLLL